MQLSEDLPEDILFPKYLYKYRSGSPQDIETLSRGKIYVPNFQQLDDYFERAYKFNRELADTHANLLFPQIIRNVFGEPVFIPTMLSRQITPEEEEEHKQRVDESIKGFRENIYSKGVYCLTRSPVDNLMWSHSTAILIGVIA